MQKFLVIKILCHLLAVLLSSCYEGWENPPKKTEAPQVPEEQPAPDKSIFYILLRPVHLSETAMTEHKCFPNYGIAEYKKQEWLERVTVLVEGLKKVSETVALKEIDISVSDCKTLGGIVLAAADNEPWPQAQKPGVDKLDRSLIEIKVILWDGDVELLPPALVTEVDWAGWKALRASGRKAISAHYFIHSHQTEGYFSQWDKELPETTKHPGTAIDDLDPTVAGKSARTELIKRDTAEFISWLLEKANE